MQHMVPAGAEPTPLTFRVLQPGSTFSQFLLHPSTMHSGISASLHQLTLGGALQVIALDSLRADLNLASAHPAACSESMQPSRSRAQAECVQHMRLKQECAALVRPPVAASQAGPVPSAAVVSLDASGDQGSPSSTPTSSASGSGGAASVRPTSGKGSRGPR